MPRKLTHRAFHTNSPLRSIEAAGEVTVNEISDGSITGAKLDASTNAILNDVANKATQTYVDNAIANNSGVEKSDTAPSNPEEGDLWYDTANELLMVYNDTEAAFLKVSPQVPSITNFAGTITKETSSTVTLTGTNFLASNLEVLFTAEGNTYTTIVTPSNGNTASVPVPSGTLSAGVGATVNIQVRNSDSQLSNVVSTTIIGRPVTLSSIDSTIAGGSSQNRTLTGTGFLTDACVVNLSASGISDAHINAQASSDTSLSFAVPSAYYNASHNLTVTISVTNNDNLTSSSITTTVQHLLGTSANPASSAVAILAEQPSASDGAYYINTSSGTVLTYCMMSWGGYMLAMKINSSFDSNFRYDGSNFTTTSPVNESSCANTSAADAVSRLYYEYTITAGVRFSMGSVGNYLNESAGGSVVNRTLKSCMTGSATSSDRSRSEFLNWQNSATGASTSNWDNQPNCNTAGFNISLNGTEHQCRWGLQMNNEGDCSSNDAAIGIGCHTNNYYSGRTGNCSAHRWNPDQIWHEDGWVWVK